MREELLKDGVAVRDASVPQTLRSLTCEYTLLHDMAEESSDQYHKIVGVFCSWYRGDVPKKAFTNELLSQFLLEKQRAGLSSYYIKSLRSHLKALYLFAGGHGVVRNVKLAKLSPESWTSEEVGRLVAATDDAYWREIIQAAFYTGLSQCDLHRVERQHFRDDGSLPWVRSKTGAEVLIGVPVEFLASLGPRIGPLWPLRTSKEYFRREFKKIVHAANLTGTFKKLRKSSGTDVELQFPGRGHEHLGNTRKIFETHYLDRSRQERQPLIPTRVLVAS